MTTTCQPPFGAVRKIFPRDGGKALTDFKEIEDGQDYVCAGLEQYRDAAYRGIVSAHTRQMANLRQYGVSTHVSALLYAFAWQCASIIFTLLPYYHIMM